MSAAKPKKLILFQLGTNNFQRRMPDGELEFAPGSGVLHDTHHTSMNQMTFNGAELRCFSVYPSHMQRPSAEDMKKERYRVFELDHPIPVCESASPTSSNRWHSFSEEAFAAYLDRLQKMVEDYIDEIEKEEGQELWMMIAHHCFTNPVVLSRVNAKRVLSGKKAVPICVFAHGTSLKMYTLELNSQKPGASEQIKKEFPMRFYRWIKDELGLFKPGGPIQGGVFVVSDEQKKAFHTLFPEFSPDQSRIFTAPCSYNTTFKSPVSSAEASPATATIFKPSEGGIKPVFYDSIVAGCDDAMKSKISAVQKLTEKGGLPLPQGKDVKLVCFAGKAADWKRWPVFLKAVKRAQEIVAEKQPSSAVVAVLMGGGPEKDLLSYHKVAFQELNLDPSSVFFLGPVGQEIMNRIFGCASAGVFTSFHEPFGLVILECMATGTPVICAKSGGPVNFVKEPDVGALVDDTDLPLEQQDTQRLGTAFGDKLAEAILDDWKAQKSKRCAEYAVQDFSTPAQVKRMLTQAEEWFKNPQKPQQPSAPAPAAAAAVAASSTKPAPAAAAAASATDYIGLAVVLCTLAYGLWRQSKI